MTEPTVDESARLTHAQHRRRAADIMAALSDTVVGEPDIEPAEMQATLMFALVHAVLSLDSSGNQGGGLTPAQIRLQQAGRL